VYKASANQTIPTVSDHLLRILCCPFCQGDLTGQETGYRCSTCDKQFPRVRGVARFVNTSNYAENFGYQWERFSRTQLMFEASERHFRKKTGLREQELKDKLVLDVGCGMGRFADVATRWGASVIGVDLSAAGEMAARNLASRDFVALQADVFELPFQPESFDLIYSIGVLHHTPDCEKALKILPRYLKPGGVLAVWLYSGYNGWYRFSDQYRKLTHRISPARLHAFFRVAVPCVYWTQRSCRAVPFVGRALAALVNHIFPVSPLANPTIRVLDTLDWYSPPYQSKHTYEQVFRWFESCGLEELTVGQVPITVRGRKPEKDECATC
jgi:SAM-dependent methyltransferase